MLYNFRAKVVQLFSTPTRGYCRAYRSPLQFRPFYPPFTMYIYTNTKPSKYLSDTNVWWSACLPENKFSFSRHPGFVKAASRFHSAMHPIALYVLHTYLRAFYEWFTNNNEAATIISFSRHPGFVKAASRFVKIRMGWKASRDVHRTSEDWGLMLVEHLCL